MADDDKKPKIPQTFFKNPTVLAKGLFTDVNEEFQPEGTYRFALNAALETSSGEKGALSNETGNSPCVDLEDEKACVIGNCLLNDGRVILFLSYQAYGIYPAHGAILVQNEDCSKEVLVRSECLEFLNTDVINCEYKIHNGCDIILYFTDRRTKYKYLNISKLDNYLIPSFTISNANTPDVNNKFGWDCGLFNFDPDYSIPSIHIVNIENGGSLRIGAYSFAVRYVDSSLNGTNWSPATNPVYITGMRGTGQALNISGGVLNPGTLIDGAYYVSKAINLKIKNLDRRYNYIQLGVFESSQETDTVNITFTSTPYSITADELSIKIYDLSAKNGFLMESSQNITIPKEYIDIVKTHAQVDRRLLVFNLQNIISDWSVFQKAAARIKTLYYTYDAVANEDGNNCRNEIINQFETGGIRGTEFNKSEFLFDNKTFMRDEVYALGIVYVFKNGKESPAFHIPGRPALGSATSTEIDGTHTVQSIVTPFETITSGKARIRWYGDYNDAWGGGFNAMFDNYNCPLSMDWDRHIYTYNDDKLKPYVTFATYDGVNVNADTAPNGFTMANTLIDKSQNTLGDSVCSTTTQVERWDFVNTSIKFNSQNATDNADPTFSAITQIRAFCPDDVRSAGLCGYYETKSLYPTTKDCDGNYIFPHTMVGNEVRMHRIRHHKMPDSRKEHFFEGQGEDESNVLIRLRPLGMMFYDIEMPIGYENELQGYYIVRSDRAGNKTVIDKGWLNVCDTSLGVTDYITLEGVVYETGILDYKAEKTIQQNPIWMAPTNKYGSAEWALYDEAPRNSKRMHKTGSNYVEFFSPKSSINEPINLQGNYYKLENTLITTTNTIERGYYKSRVLDLDNVSWNFPNDCEEPNGWEGYSAWRVYGMLEVSKIKLPRMFTYENHTDFYLLHNIPLLYSEYALYNQDDLLSDGFTSNNENHRQNILLSKLYNEEYSVKSLSFSLLNISSIFKPMAYTMGISALSPYDLITPPTRQNTYTGSPTYPYIDVDFLIYPNLNVNNLENNSRLHIYYAALKNNIKPYDKLENIIYIKASNQVQRFPQTGKGVVFESGGDCFITKQRMYKSFQKGTKNDEADNGNNNGKLAGTILIGYVESEINTHFRHKFSEDKYYAVPFDALETSLRKNVKDVHEATVTLTDFIEHIYRYNLDFSSDNRNRLYFPLTDVFDYCSECSERFPHTFRYSEPSLSTQVADNYKLFLSSSIQEIPTDTGEITNAVIKEQSLFIQTVSNMYRVNLAPQELETGNDRIQVGSGTLATAVPQKMFDNTSGYGRGGTEFEHAGVFCNDSYIWVDNKSGRVYSLSKGVEEISLKGMDKWFRNNLFLTYRNQWKNITGTDYPYLNTSSNKCIGFNAGFDPYYNRYILHKKDYEITEGILSILSKDTGSPYIIDNYYWNGTGLYKAISNTLLEEVNLESNRLIKNKSFTVSFGLESQVWVSFHSYRPNHMWNNNTSFFTSINNIDFAAVGWKHGEKNYQKYYNHKHDFVYEYVAKGEEPLATKNYDNIEIMGNVYVFNENTNAWKEVFYATFNKLFVYNNGQSSGLFNLIIKNPSSYYDTYNNQITSNTLSINRQLDIWKVNNLRDYTKDATTASLDTIITTDWSNTVYSDVFRDNQNMGYIDYVSNSDYIDFNKNVYELQRFRDKFLNVRLFFKPEEDFKIVINAMANLKRLIT